METVFNLFRGHHRKDIRVETNGTVLTTGFRDKTDTLKTPFLELYIEGVPVAFILFHALSSTDDFTAAVFIYTNGCKNGNILDLAVPTVFEIDTVNIGIRIFTRKWAGTQLF